MNISRGKTMKNANRTSLIKQVQLIIIYLEYMLRMLIYAQQQRPRQSFRNQYRKNRHLLGHVRKGKEAVFCFFVRYFFFPIYDSGLCQTVKYRNTNQWKNECEYEIIYWKKHCWSLLFEVIQRAKRFPTHQSLVSVHAHLPVFYSYPLDTNL